MKKYIFLFSLLVIGLLTGCKESIDDRGPSPEYTGTPCEVYFESATIKEEYKPEDGATMYNVPVKRSNTSCNSFELTVSDDADECFVNVPTTVTFAGESLEGLITLEFPTAKENVEHTITLTVVSKELNPYAERLGSRQCTFTFSIADWSEVKTCIVQDGLFVKLLNDGSEIDPFYAQYQELNASDGSKKFRLLAPYRTLGLNADENGIYDGFPLWNKSAYTQLWSGTPAGDYYFNINVDKDGKAKVPYQVLGLDLTAVGAPTNSTEVGMLKTSLDGVYDVTKENIVFEDGTFAICFDGDIYNYSAEMKIWFDKDKFLASQVPSEPNPELHFTLTTTDGLPTGYTDVVLGQYDSKKKRTTPIDLMTNEGDGTFTLTTEALPKGANYVYVLTDANYDPDYFSADAFAGTEEGEALIGTVGTETEIADEVNRFDWIVTYTPSIFNIVTDGYPTGFDYVVLMAVDLTSGKLYVTDVGAFQQDPRTGYYEASIQSTSYQKGDAYTYFLTADLRNLNVYEQDPAAAAKGKPGVNMIHYLDGTLQAEDAVLSTNWYQRPTTPPSGVAPRMRLNKPTLGGSSNQSKKWVIQSTQPVPATDIRKEL